MKPKWRTQVFVMVRVIKGLMSRGYNAVRVSLVSPAETPNKVSGFDYNKKFEWKWQHAARPLSSSLIAVPPAKGRCLASQLSLPRRTLHVGER